MLPSESIDKQIRIIHNKNISFCGQRLFIFPQCVNVSIAKFI